MKQKREFASVEMYKEYLLHYYAGQALVGAMADLDQFVSKDSLIESCVEFAERLVSKLDIE